MLYAFVFAEIKYIRIWSIVALQILLHKTLTLTSVLSQLYTHLLNQKLLFKPYHILPGDVNSFQELCLEMNTNLTAVPSLDLFDVQVCRLNIMVL